MTSSTTWAEEDCRAHGAGSTSAIPSSVVGRNNAKQFFENKDVAAAVEAEFAALGLHRVPDQGRPGTAEG